MTVFFCPRYVAIMAFHEEPNSPCVPHSRLSVLLLHRGDGVVSRHAERKHRTATRLARACTWLCERRSTSPSGASGASADQTPTTADTSFNPACESMKIITKIKGAFSQTLPAGLFQNPSLVILRKLVLFGLYLSPANSHLMDFLPTVSFVLNKSSFRFTVSSLRALVPCPLAACLVRGLPAPVCLSASSSPLTAAFCSAPLNSSVPSTNEAQRALFRRKVRQGLTQPRQRFLPPLTRRASHCTSLVHGRVGRVD